MTSRPPRFRAAFALTIFSLLLGRADISSAVAVSSTELGCAKGLGKGAAKLAKVTMKELAGCKGADISGKAVGACPNAANLTNIAAAEATVSSLAQACTSTCSTATANECIANSLCPPIVGPGFGSPDDCAGDGKFFDVTHLAFPGTCEVEIGHKLTKAADIGQCVGAVAGSASAALIDAVYGSITNASSISLDAQKCLSSISKGAQKVSGVIVKGVSKCRNAILGGVSGDPSACQTSDLKLAAKIAKLETKLDGLVSGACTPGTLAELDLCGNGVGGTTTVVDAQTCVKAAVREISDTKTPPVLRDYGANSIIDAAYPAPARCGDNVINQIPNSQLLLGEECDGADDSACPGACLPPGDAFECTCGNKKRMRLFASHEETDADAGWTGLSHQQGVSDLSGYITELSNCDCDEFDGPTCIGTSSDPVCTVTGHQAPSCSWDLFSATRCDAHSAVPNTTDEDKDCAICDTWSSNAGAWCKDERDCDAQCYDSNDAATGPCTNQSDCPSGQICRGQCDHTPKCAIIPNGAPLPVAAQGAQVCAVNKFRVDVGGTRNIITGSHDVTYQLYSTIYLGEAGTRPCPVCGGFCVGGNNDNEVCEGRCSTTSSTSCRFATDCPIGETCSTASPDCPSGFCQLDLICGSSDVTVAGKPCHAEYDHPYFGTMSNDCLPGSPSINGLGFQINYLPGTSGSVSLPSTYPCTATGFDNYLCACPGVGGQATKPNACSPACNAVGPDFGVGCATGNNNSGAGSTCVAGTKNGKLCKGPADCPGGTCTNPTHCEGDPSFDHTPCTSNAQCGIGTCQDACPGGECVPLCLPTIPDPDEGLCAAGPPVTSCSNPRYQYIVCPLANAQSGTCSATCSVAATPCDSKSDCPAGETCNGPCSKAYQCEAGTDAILGTVDDIQGAGNCVEYPHSCYLEPIAGTGGSTLNGQGDPEHDYRVATFCYTATNNGAVNATSGFPGPGRVRQHGTNITNGFTSIP